MKKSKKSHKKSIKSPSFLDVLKSFQYWPRILSLLWKANPYYLVLVFVLNILASLIPAANVLLTQLLVTQVGLVIENQAKSIFLVFFLFALLGLLREVIRILSENYEAIYSELLNNQINILLMEKANSLPYKYFEDSDAYDKLQRVREDSTFRPFQIFQQILSVKGSIITIFSVAGVLLLWKWWLAVILLLIPFIFSFSLLRVGEEEFQINWRRATNRRRQYYILGLMTSDSSAKEVKAFDVGPRLIEKYRYFYSKFFKEDKQLILKRTRVTLSLQTIGIIAVIGMQYFVIQQTIAGVLTIATMIAYIQAISQTQSTSSNLMYTLFMMYQNNRYVRQLFEFLDINEMEDKESLIVGSFPKRERNSGLVFRNVSFKYPGTNQYVLKNVSFHLKPGETLAIVGENGSGKTTIVKLLVRLYELEEGDITYNGRSIKSYSIREWREIIGAVFQDFIRYELTAKENIALGNWRFAEDKIRIKNAAKYSGALTIIEKLPQGMETQLGKWFKEGIQLSGGQWQKIAIARAYMRDADIYILDEPTAALDPKAEKEVFEKFKELTKNKMGIFISHRYSTVQNASKILVLQKGKVIESGSHSTLMEIDGVYASLYRLQASSYLEKNTNFYLLGTKEW